MSRFQRYTNLAAVVIPFLATLVAIVLLWNQAIGVTDLVIMLTMYLVTAVGITVDLYGHLSRSRSNASRVSL